MIDHLRQINEFYAKKRYDLHKKRRAFISKNPN
jgi:hypothetical protein